VYSVIKSPYFSFEFPFKERSRTHLNLSEIKVKGQLCRLAITWNYIQLQFQLGLPAPAADTDAAAVLQLEFMAETSAVKSPAGECRPNEDVWVLAKFMRGWLMGGVYVCWPLKCNQQHGGNYGRHLCG